MPTIRATKTPQAAATAISRARLRVGWWGASLIVYLILWPQPARLELDDGEKEEQQHHRAEGERDGNRPRALATFLLLGEHDAVFSILVHVVISPVTSPGQAGGRADHRPGASQKGGKDRVSRRRRASWRQ